MWVIAKRSIDYMGELGPLKANTQLVACLATSATELKIQIMYYWYKNLNNINNNIKQLIIDMYICVRC